MIFGITGYHDKPTQDCDFAQNLRAHDHSPNRFGNHAYSFHDFYNPYKRIDRMKQVDYDLIHSNHSSENAYKVHSENTENFTISDHPHAVAIKSAK